jgi:hypothetical protein
MFDTASMKVRQGDPLVGKVLLNRLANCAQISNDCPFRAECQNMGCRIGEAADAA